MARDDDIDVKVSLKGRQRFSQETRSASRDVDDLGDEIETMGDKAARATAKLGALGVASTATRVNLGPFSTSMRGGALAIGGLANATGGLIPAVLSGAEALAVMTGGAAAAGGVGLLGVAQAAGVAKLGLGGLMDALGGNETAARKLSPELRVLFSQLQGVQEGLQASAQEGMLPGLEQGIGAAMRNVPVLERIVDSTARTLGGLAADAGGMLGSAEWGRDLDRLGAANVAIIDDLGHAGLNLADALRDVAVEAAPLAKWLASEALSGAQGVAAWTERARASGDMARFFREARVDLQLLGSSTGHLAGGLINLFGAQDVDGTRTLRNLDRILARFERWTNSPAVREDLGDAIVAEIPDAVGAAVSGLAHALPGAGATAARMFIEGFLEADVWGKLLLGGALAHKLGGFKAAGRLLGRGGGGPLGGVALKGGGVPVWVLNPGFGAPTKTPKGILPAAKELLKPRNLARGGVAAAAAYGAYKDSQALLNDLQREQARTGGWTPEHRRREAARTQQSIVPLSGVRAPARRPEVDAQGFPTGKMEIIVPVHIDSVKVGQLNAQVLERRQARN